MGKQLFFILLTISLLAGCYEPKEGCLNVNAVNYDVTADDACGDCCTLPVISLSVQHVIRTTNDTVSFQYGVLYPSEAAPHVNFVVDKATFFISHLRLVKEDGEEIGVSDSLKLEYDNGNEVTVEDSYAKIDRNSFQARQIGTMVTQGKVASVKFTLGLDDFLLQPDVPNNVPSGHPLDIDSDSLIYDEAAGYIPNFLIVRRDTAAWADSLAFKYFEPIAYTLPLDNPFTIERGYNIKLTLKVDYQDLFSGVDFQLDNFQTLEEKIKNNLGNVFYVTEIKLE